MYRKNDIKHRATVKWYIPSGTLPFRIQHNSKGMENTILEANRIYKGISKGKYTTKCNTSANMMSRIF